METEHILEVDHTSRTPISVQVSRQLAWLISAGRLVAGDRLPPLRVLADRLGINLHTVSAAYRHLEEDGLVATRHGSGTYVLPRDPGRHTRHGSDVPASTFGVVVPAYTDLYRRVIDGIEMVAYQAPALLFVGSAHESAEIGLRTVERMIGRGVDGIIVTAPLLPPDEVPGLLASFPAIVFCDWPAGPQPGVLFDLEGGVGDAVRHLIGHGHRSIGLIAPPADWQNASPVHQGYRRALAEADLAPGPMVTVYDYTLEAGVQVDTRLAALPHPPTAVIADNDATAVGLLRSARRRGLRLPDDLAVIGMGGSQLGALVEPALTTVDLPATKMGREAMRILLNLCRGIPPEPSGLMLGTNLTIRQSCGCAATDPDT